MSILLPFIVCYQKYKAKIEPEYLERYQALFKSYSQRKASYNHQKQAMSESFKRQLTDFTTTYPHKKSKLPPMPLVQLSSPFHSQSSVSELSSPVVIPHNVPSNCKPKHYRQQTFDKAI